MKTMLKYDAERLERGFLSLGAEGGRHDGGRRISKNLKEGKEINEIKWEYVGQIREKYRMYLPKRERCILI